MAERRGLTGDPNQSGTSLRPVSGLHAAHNPRTGSKTAPTGAKPLPIAQQCWRSANFPSCDQRIYLLLGWLNCSGVVLSGACSMGAEAMVEPLLELEATVVGERQGALHRVADAAESAQPSKQR